MNQSKWWQQKHKGGETPTKQENENNIFDCVFYNHKNVYMKININAIVMWIYIN